MMPIRNLRSDATWNEQAADQIGRLDAWRFEEKLSYAEIRRWLAAEFNLKAFQTSLEDAVKSACRSEKAADVSLFQLISAYFRINFF